MDIKQRVVKKFSTKMSVGAEVVRAVFLEIKMAHVIITIKMFKRQEHLMLSFP